MKSIPVSVFKAKCLGLVDEVRRTSETIEMTKRGQPISLLTPLSRDSVDWTPGAPRNRARIVGDIECDLADLGVEFETALRSGGVTWQGGTPPLHPSRRFATESGTQ